METANVIWVATIFFFLGVSLGSWLREKHILERIEIDRKIRGLRRGELVRFPGEIREMRRNKPDDEGGPSAA